MDFGAECYSRFLAGEETAFDELMNTYHDNLIYFINGIIHNFAVSEEIAADTFVELLIHKNRYKGKSEFKTYLFSIAKNKAIDYIRRTARHKCIAIDELAEFADGKNLEKSVINSDKKKRVNQVIETLPPDYRMVIHLIYFEDLSYMAAAQVLGKNKKQIDNLVYRAKNMLKVSLEKEGIGFEE